MDISEVREAKSMLEHDIRRFLSGRLQDFRNHTGEQVESISVDFHDLTFVGQTRPNPVLEGVCVGVVL